MSETSFPFGEYDREQMARLLAAADQDPAFKGQVFPDQNRPRLPILREGVLVGFATPTQEADGVWSLGAVYVDPEFRRQGLATLAIRTFMTRRRGRAFIEEANLASRKTYKNAGFRAVRSATGGRWWENF